MSDHYATKAICQNPFVITTITEYECSLRSITNVALIMTFLNAGRVKRLNVCKRYVAIDAGFKQTERTIFLHVISIGLKL